MQSLSMSLRSSSSANLLLLGSEARVRRRSRTVTVACNSQGESGSSSTSSFLSRTQTYALLKQQLQVAAKSENYKEAARIRDSLKLFEEEEPVLRLRRLLKEAIAEERFQEILHVRDELLQQLKDNLIKAQNYMKQQADKRGEMQLEVGDLALAKLQPYK